jgi:hypothetical protein
MSILSIFSGNPANLQNTGYNLALFARGFPWSRAQMGHSTSLMFGERFVFCIVGKEKPLHASLRTAMR